MSSHVHRQILDALTALLTGLATTGANVFPERADEQPLQAAELPALRFNLDEEAGAISEFGPPRNRVRTAVLSVQACVKSMSGAADTVDAIFREVEVALDAGGTLAGLANSIELRGFEFELTDVADETVAVGTTRYDIVYHTAQSAPTVAMT